ncbi:MAG: hypothetical protein C0184_05760 [Chloroflexus aggregans]|uniref:Uncharacterized protein n=1 Tax=Chloroflexus aggregans TaxID=152260 RepID=A0A2J6X7T7_9CHLR|nr:MAG: hypothetical protein C0184_05760 [Chloroflexus aggregans]
MLERNLATLVGIGMLNSGALTNTASCIIGCSSVASNQSTFTGNNGAGCTYAMCIIDERYADYLWIVLHRC